VSAEVPHKALCEWVQEWAELFQPSALHWCDGSAQEYAELCRRLVDVGTLVPLAAERRPGSYLCRSVTLPG
jgi:phosphoenolpyruvate carboxykinase (GTP)